MKILLDTHVLLWAAGEAEKLSTDARALLEDPGNTLVFSAASVWEIVIKSALGRSDFRVDVALLRRGLLDNGYTELAILSAHAVAVGELPTIHKDPFDRMLIAQSKVEGMMLLTADATVLQYRGVIMSA